MIIRIGNVSWLPAVLFLLFVHAFMPVVSAAAQSAGSLVSLSYIPGSSVKVDQIAGDQDDGSPLFVRPPGVPMAADNAPNSGISLSDGIYLVC